MAGRPATLKVDIVADAKGVSKGVAEADSRFGKLASIGGKVGVGLAAGFAVAGTAAVAFAASSVRAASDVQQSLGALDSVFGKNSATVAKWAKDASATVGLSQSSYAQLAAVVGAQLTGMGQSQDKAAASTQNLIKLGADLSATFGGSVSDAVSAVSSLLKGEADPIERYGVSIKQSDVNARLAAQGLDKLTGNALKQAQAQATLQLLTEKTKNSVGAFGRESDTLAHKQQVLSAQFENVKAQVGNALLPVMTQLTGLVSTYLIPAFGQAAAYVQTRVVPVLTQLYQRIQTAVAPTIARLAIYFQTVLLPAFRSIANYVLTVVVPGFERALVPILQGVAGYIRTVTTKVEENKDSFIKLWHGIQPVITFLATKVAPLVGTVIGKSFDAMGKAISAVIETVATLIDLISTAVDKIKALARAIKDNPVGRGLGAVSSFVGSHNPLLLARPSNTTTTAAATGDNITINVSGAIDPIGTARQIEALLRTQGVRAGRLPTFTPAVG